MPCWFSCMPCWSSCKPVFKLTLSSSVLSLRSASRSLLEGCSSHSTIPAPTKSVPPLRPRAQRQVGWDSLKASAADTKPAGSLCARPKGVGAASLTRDRTTLATRDIRCCNNTKECAAQKQSLRARAGSKCSPQSVFRGQIVEARAQCVLTCIVPWRPALSSFALSANRRGSISSRTSCGTASKRVLPGLGKHLLGGSWEHI